MLSKTGWMVVDTAIANEERLFKKIVDRLPLMYASEEEAKDHCDNRYGDDEEPEDLACQGK